MWNKEDVAKLFLLLFEGKSMRRSGHFSHNVELRWLKKLFESMISRNKLFPLTSSLVVVHPMMCDTAWFFMTVSDHLPLHVLKMYATFQLKASPSPSSSAETKHDRVIYSIWQAATYMYIATWSLVFLGALVIVKDSRGQPVRAADDSFIVLSSCPPPWSYVLI